MNNAERMNIKRIAAEIDLIAEQAFRTIMFDPIDNATLQNFRSLLSRGISQIKNRGSISNYTIDVDFTRGTDTGLSGEITFTPYSAVQTVNINFSINSGSSDSKQQSFDRAMKGI